MVQVMGANSTQIEPNHYLNIGYMACVNQSVSPVMPSLNPLLETGFPSQGPSIWPLLKGL